MSGLMSHEQVAVLCVDVVVDDGIHGCLWIAGWRVAWAHRGLLFVLLWLLMQISVMMGQMARYSRCDVLELLMGSQAEGHVLFVLLWLLLMKISMLMS